MWRHMRCPRSLVVALLVALAACEGEIERAPGLATSRNDGSVTPPEVIPPFEPATLQGHVLVSGQYVNAIRDVLGDAAASAVTPPGDVSINGFAAIGAGTISLSTA